MVRRAGISVQIGTSDRRNRRWVSISHKIRRLIDRLVVEPSFHHQPSRSMVRHAARKRSADRGKIRIGVVQAENQAAGSDPTQRETLGAKVVLQHPVVA